MERCYCKEPRRLSGALDDMLYQMGEQQKAERERRKSAERLWQALDELGYQPVLENENLWHTECGKSLQKRLKRLGLEEKLRAMGFWDIAGEKPFNSPDFLTFFFIFLYFAFVAVMTCGVIIKAIL